MTSKHYRWQARWTFAGTLATHETGLRVHLQGLDAAGACICSCDNELEVVAALAPQHGGHNAPAMVRRLLGEARQLFEAARRDVSRAA